MSYFTIFVSQPSHDSSNAFKEPQDLAAASNRCISTHKYRTGASTNWILDNHQMKFDYNRNCNKYTDGPLNEKPISNSKLDDNESGKTNKQKRLIIKPYANNKHHQNTYASVLKCCLCRLKMQLIMKNYGIIISRDRSQPWLDRPG